jgi:glycosyltransferase involved in cell wall biosynthesis
VAKRRILYLIGSLERGGAEQHLVRLATGLKARGWEPEVYPFVPGGPLGADLATAGVPVHARSLPQWLERALSNPRVKSWVQLAYTSLALWKLMHKERYDAVHFFLPAAYIVGGVVSLVAPVGVRAMSRRSRNHYHSRRRVFAVIERWLHARMSVISGNSQAVVQDLIGEGVDPAKIVLIHNGIDMARFDTPRDRSAIRAREGLSNDALTLVCVANLIGYKGHADLLSALDQIEDEMPTSWQLLCIGRDDGVQESLEAFLQGGSLAKHIRFMGSRDDVDQLLSVSDLGILASHEEGFSNAVLEKMAAGLPVIVTDVGGNAEAIQDGVSGYVVPPHDSVSLAAAIKTVINHPDASALGRAARERVSQHFSMETCLSAYETMYIKALSRKAAD